MSPRTNLYLEMVWLEGFHYIKRLVGHAKLKNAVSSGAATIGDSHSNWAVSMNSRWSIPVNSVFPNSVGLHSSLMYAAKRNGSLSPGKISIPCRNLVWCVISFDCIPKQHCYQIGTVFVIIFLYVFFVPETDMGHILIYFKCLCHCHWASVISVVL